MGGCDLKCENGERCQSQIPHVLGQWYKFAPEISEKHRDISKDM